jgi:cell division septation protein DedD
MRGMTLARSCRLSALILAVALPSFAAAAADPPPKSPLDEAAVRALIGRWLDAQNKGDFAAYTALYTPSFHGIRRSLGRTVVLDYQGWLRDRGRMFKKPMKVAATDVQIARTAPASGLLRATFVQEFSSGNYADRGRKQIDVAAIGGALVIAREELLESERLPAASAAGKAPADSIATTTAAPKAPVAHPDEAACPTAKTVPFTGTFRGEPGWLVVGDTSADATAITARALKLEAAGVEAHPIATDSFEGLASGQFAVVHGAFATRAEAEALVEALRPRKIKAYAKESGPLRGGGRLVEIRGVAARNGTRGRWPLLVTSDDGGEGTVRSAANGQFVMWMAASGKLDIQNEAETPDKHNMRASAGVCIELPSSSGRVDVGTLDTTTWLCDN